MFRCKECQAEYETKPDYCDCGNDTFDEIKIEVQKPEEKETIKEKVVEAKPEPPKPEAQPKIEVTQENIVSKISKQPSDISTFAWIFFAICIILSLLIIFVIGNPTAKEDLTTEQKVEAQTNDKLPNIDDLWNNKLPKIEVKTIEQKPEIPVQVETKKKSVNDAPQPVKKVQSNSKKPTTNTVAKTSKTVQKTPTNTQTAKKTTSSANKQELANYKINLRNKIASRIDFASIVGDGSCVVSFKISNSGQLTNRNFAVQSENTSLNDVVYRAMMQTPSYIAPPQGYNGETLRLSVKIYSGSFEVSLN